MIDGREDQAAGLRRLFRQTPPAVAAFYATGRYRAHHAILAAQRIARGHRKVLLLDEAVGDEALAASLGLPPGPDLLQMLDGRLTLAGLLQPVAGLFGRVPAAAAALALPLLDEARRACLLEALRVLHRHAGFVLIHAGRDSAQDPSPFVQAAPQRLLVAEASASGASEAYQIIKQLSVAGAGSMHVAVARARNAEDGRNFFISLQALVRQHIGVPLLWLGEVEHDDLAAGLTRTPAPPLARETGAAFLRRLAGANAGTWRVAGSVSG
ncbi:MAG: flagellar FleN [Azoarcus sp.]|jgi:flagellar biosynthesis protein FlhG|nr:flagellar FleN [Azoarcus sp.]